MAQLELSVVLNLANFRTQLGKLAQASAAYYYPINLTIDQKAFKRQLAALGNIKTTLKINDRQLDSARERIGRLNKSLATLRRATSTPIVIETRYKATGDVPAARTPAKKAVATAVKGQDLIDTASYSELQKLYKFANAAGLQFERLKRGAASSTADLRRVLGPAFREIGSNVLAGIKTGLANADSELAKIAQGMGSGLISKTKNALGIKSPSRPFMEIGKNVVAGLEIGLDNFDALQVKMVGKMREFVAVMRMEAAKIQGIPMAPGMSQSAGSRGSRQYMSPIGPLPEGSKEPWAFSQYRYQPFMAQPGQTRGANVPPMRARFPFAEAPSIMGTTTSPSMFGASFPALPSAGMTGGNAVRQAQLQSRMAAAYARSAAREASVLGESQMYASVSGQVPLGNTAPRLPAGNRGGALALRDSGGGGVGGAFGGMQLNMPQLPGSGLVREIGAEFGFAAKQVLLFGTAYKALAFLQGFPAQVGEAVGALQSFRNTIKEISPSAQEAANSSQFILDIVDKYNTPLQSARDGFVKLYASMQPAGFSGNEIRDLFLGISQTAATFGMSADKVDRVNYAFAQMASKGQVMSEELKGQLGDVLPGAMAIFAEAAGFKGPEAITKFSKALEDGAYKGGAMKTLLTNVGSIMRKEFGPGAEGAARTFQGVMNRMQNSAKLLYEAFEPVAVGFLNSVVMPLTSGLKTVTDGFNAFFTGVNAKTSGGFAFAQELEKLRPTFEGLRTNAIGLAQVFGEFAKVALGVGSALLQIAGNPIVGFMAKIYAIMVPLNMALGVMRGLWALNSLQLLLFNARVAMGVPTLSAFRGMMQATGATAAVTATSIRTAGLTLRTFFASTGVGLILVGISLLIERFMSMNQTLADTRAKALGAADAIRAMSQTEARQASQQYGRQAQSLKGLSREIEEGKMKGKAWIEVTKEQAEALKSAGVTVSDVRGSLQVQPMRVGGAYQKVEGLAAEARYRVRVLDYQDKQSKQQASIAPIPPGTGDGTDAQRAADKAASQQQQAAIDAANRQNALDKSRFEGLTALSEQDYQHRIDLINLAHEYELNGLNSIEARQTKFQQELQKIELKRIETVRKAQEQMQKAQLDYTAAQRTASAAGTTAPQKSGLPSGVSGYITGDPKSSYYKADHGGSNYHEHLSFVSRKAAEEAYNKLRSAGITVTEFMGYGKVGRHTPGSKHYEGLAFDVPGAQVPVGKEPALTARVQSILGFSGTGTAATMQRRSEKAGGAAGVEQQDLLYRGMESGLSIINATTVALKERENLIAANINTIFPVAEQKLENDLMKMRNQLQLQGMPQEYIDFQEQQYKTTYETAEAIKSKRKETLEYTKTVEVLQAKQAQGKALTAEEAESLRFYTGAIKQNDQALTSLTERQKAYNIAALEGAIASIKNADALKAQQDAISLIDGNVESATGSYKNFIKEVARGGDAKEALKKFQESITDQVLTVFLDYSFKPVEEFFKNSLKNMFGLPDAEKAKQDQLAKMEAQLAEQKKIAVATDQTAKNTAPGAGENAGTTQSPVAGSAFAPGTERCLRLQQALTQQASLATPKR
jgi:tape measure domain-containing protein